MDEAVAQMKEYLAGTISAMLNPDGGSGLMDHAFDFDLKPEYRKLVGR